MTDVISGSRPWNPKGDSRLLYDFLPVDSSHQAEGLQECLAALRRLFPEGIEITLVDLGCGTGSSYDAFSRQGKKLRWVGLDITGSQEVCARDRRDLAFCAYDGVRIPFASDSVDVLYSHQVFEHVRHPEALLAEVHRALKPGGVFVGSTSHLEPFHSRSYWNYTPYGFCALLQDAGFCSIQVRPGIDSLTLIGRRCFSYVKLARLFQPFFKVESPLNALLELALRFLGQPVQRRNAFKLLFAGQFCFIARK
jgi:SAM-dependent methyltransferase